jgi:hypothetical protein
MVLTLVTTAGVVIMMNLQHQDAQRIKDMKTKGAAK